MSSSAATPGLGPSSLDGDAARGAARSVAGFWWIGLVVGVMWLVAALVILQFDQASITTVGILVGVMFTVAGIQQIALGTLVDSFRWLWFLFGVLFLAAGVICFINPEKTFAGLADILGFLFLTVGAWWLIRAVLERGENPLWWLGLVGGIFMVILAFWTSGQFFIDKSYTLLVFAGIWALMQGISDISRAFLLRAVRDAL
jgi:uncharacterized membrane protein HdeD (DUF308 family)